ncbi:uroporphyrinogen-III synthase [Wenxinia saemankumensis]|uniref:Uroporphyrinogen-III synthase n=2 Tax=Wenxinia saemankumensis TaxID=1447782 RepID=A0A1M6G3X8_9RHOB|nr:uroporphyrinogen-III synthase [Wenxinia saemankumensis]
MLGSDWPVHVSPLTRIVPLSPRVGGGWGTIVVTSANGAAALGRLGLDPRIPVVAVGERTAEAARQAGFAARMRGPDAAGLARALIADPPPGPVLHLRGAEGAGDIAGTLRAAGLPCEEVIAYRQEDAVPTDAALSLLAGGAPVAVPLYSPASARRLAALPIRAPLLVAALSPAVASVAAAMAPERLVVASEPAGAFILRELRALVLP